MKKQQQKYNSKLNKKARLGLEVRYEIWCKFIRTLLPLDEARPLIESVDLAEIVDKQKKEEEEVAIILALRRSR